MPTVHDDAADTLDSVIGIQGVETGGSGANMGLTGGTGHVVKQASVGAAFTTGTIASADIADNAITNAKLRDSAALSVIGRSVNSSGDPADIAAGGQNRVLMRNNSNLLLFARTPEYIVTELTGGGSDAAANTTILQAYLDISGSHVVLLPEGSFQLNPVTISQTGVHLIGGGERVTNLYFDGGAGTMIHVTNTSQNVVGGFSFYSNNTTAAKVVIKLTNTSRTTIRNLDSQSTSWRGTGSIGIQILGREFLVVEDCVLAVNTPISIEKNPDGPYELDLATFKRIWYLPSSVNNSVNIATGLIIARSKWTDYHSMIGGANGFYWVDTTGSAYCFDITLEGIFQEQNSGSGYAINIEHNHGIRNLRLDTIGCGLANGIRLRNCERVTARGVSYVGSGEAWNLDGSVEDITFDGCLVNAGATISTTGLTRVRAQVHSTATAEPTHNSETWMSSANPHIGQAIIVSDASFNIADSADQAKRLQFNAANVATATTRVATWPGDYNGTIATLAGTETLSGKVYQGTSIQTSGNSGFGVAPSGTAGQLVTVASSANERALVLVQTTSNGASAAATLRVTNDASVASSLHTHGSGNTGTRAGVTIGGYGELSTASTSGLLVGTTGAVPIRVYTNTTKVGAMFDGTNGHPSFPASHKRVSVQYDNTTTTLGNVTGLTVDATAGKTYGFRAVLHTTSDVGGGVKCAIAGTATATAIVYDTTVYQGGQAVATTTQRGTAMGAVTGQITAVTTAKIIIEGVITVNVAGTLLPQLACNVAAGTTSALVGSEWLVWEIQ